MGTCPCKCTAVRSGEHIVASYPTSTEIYSKAGYHMTFNASIEIEKNIILEHDEYIIVRDTSNNDIQLIIVNGPIQWVPENGNQKIVTVDGKKDIYKRKMMELENDEYLITKDTSKNPPHYQMIEGPCIYLPSSPYIEFEEKKKKHVITEFQYLCVTQNETKKIMSGPLTFSCDPQNEYSIHDKLFVSESQYAIVFDIESEEQTLIEGEIYLIPEPSKKYTINEKVLLSELQYVIVEDTKTYTKDIIEGPCVIIQEPNKKYSSIMMKIYIEPDKYIFVTDLTSGDKKIIEGPLIFTPKPSYRVDTIIVDKKTKVNFHQKKNISQNQFVKIKTTSTGCVKVLKGPRSVFEDFDEEILEIGKMVMLNDTQYLYVTHEDNGTIDIVSGPRIVCPGPYDQLSSIKNIIPLMKDEYVKIKDNKSGKIRVVQGENKIILLYNEEQITDICKAHEINDQTGVIVKDMDTGDIKLITLNENQNPYMFFPTPNQDIVDQHKKIILQRHEIVVIIDETGDYSFKSGKDDTKSFFIHPKSRLLTHFWSTDLTDESTTREVTRFDSRRQYMDFEFNVCTSDNVEIKMNLNFYWQIVDLTKLVKKTDNVTKDICMFVINQISNIIMKKKMHEISNEILMLIQENLSTDDQFFEDRGVIIHRIEVTKWKYTLDILEEEYQMMIKETANNIRKSVQLEWELKFETMKSELNKLQHSNAEDITQNTWLYDGSKIAKFLENLPSELSMETKLSLFNQYQMVEQEKFKWLNESRREQNHNGNIENPDEKPEEV